MTLRPVLIALLAFALPALGWCQTNIVSNGGFEDLAAGVSPAGWQLMGSISTSDQAHSGNRAVLLQRGPGEPGETGLNLDWQAMSGRQGAMLSRLKGGITFWYRIDQASRGDDLQFFIIPMSADPLENTATQRAVFKAPSGHIADGKWHSAALKYDFTADPKVRWVQVSPRIMGDNTRVLLDDIAWVPSVGPQLTFTKTSLAEVPGSEGEACVVSASLMSIGDQPVDMALASIAVERGLEPEGGPVRPIADLRPDAVANVSWRILGSREAAGRLALSATAGSATASTEVRYAPALEITSFAPAEFIIPCGQPGQVVLTVRNSGHATLRHLTADLRPSAPLGLSGTGRSQTVDALPPQTETSLIWPLASRVQTPRVAAAVVVEAANAERARATTTFVVGPPTPRVQPVGRGAQAVVAPDYALVGNDALRLLFPRAAFGYGIALLQRPVDGRWETVGKLPCLTRLVTLDAAGKPAEATLYASEVRTVDSPEAVGPQMLPATLELRALHTDAAGIRWTITQTATIRPGGDTLSLRISAIPDREAPLLALDGPMLYAGEGAAPGTRRLDAIFPGLEWLVEGEQSSSDLDIAANHPDRIRYVPHPHYVTIPLMCARLAPPRGQATTVTLQWDHLSPYLPGHDRPSAAFASPDRFEARASTLMGIFAPSMPEYIAPNQRVAHTPLTVPAGQPVELACRIAALPAPAGSTALEAVKLWARDNPLPAPNPYPHGKTLTDELAFSMAGYLDSLWLPEEQLWMPSLGGPKVYETPGIFPHYLYDMRRYLDAAPEGDVRERVAQRYAWAIKRGGIAPEAEDLGYDYAGPTTRLIGRADEAARLLASQESDGSWRFRTRIESSGVFKGMDYSELGPDNAAEVGTCAANAYALLEFALATGDVQAREAGLKALEFMTRYQVPRAAQVWEVPLHTPDILASADACDACLTGYQLTGERRYLDAAVYWAWTGLPFIYTWDTPGFEFLRYASIPVFGATWFQGSWFGRPVQWNGLEYATALYRLSKYDMSLDWGRVARGITVSAMYQQSTDGKDRALWPDNIGAVNKDRCPWVFAPRLILRNVYYAMGLEPQPNVIVTGPPGQQFRIAATGALSDATLVGDTLSLKLAYTAPQSGFLTVCGISAASSVTDNGTAVPRALTAGEVPGAYWRLNTDANILELRVPQTGGHNITITGITAAPTRLLAPIATVLDFGFDAGLEGWRAAHDLQSPQVANGSLSAATTGGDPYLVRSTCEFQASAIRQIRVRLALDPGLVPDLQFFWSTSQQPSLDEAKSVRASTVADGEFHEVVFPVGDNPLWTGKITSIRLDPAGGGTGAIRVDSIRGE